MGAFKVKIVVTKSVTITEKMWVDECMSAKDFNEFQAAQFAKGIMIEELRNNPNRGSVYIEKIS